MTIPTDKLKDILENVDGWLSKSDAELLIKYASQVTEPNCIVEIGSYKGRSTISMATYSSVPVYSVDPHISSFGDSYQFGDKDRADFCRNLVGFGVADKVRQINLNSIDTALIWWQPVGFLFVDGQHNYEGVRDELEWWIPHIIDGGFLAIHDNYSKLIMRAVNERTDLEFIEGADITSVYKVKKTNA